MAKKINVFIKEPGQKPKHVWISNSEENLKKWLGGNYKFVGLSTDVDIMYNEDMIFSNLHFNCNICDVQFFGTIIFVGTGEEDEVISLPDDFDVKAMKRLFPQLYEEGEKNV